MYKCIDTNPPTHYTQNYCIRLINYLERFGCVMGVSGGRVTAGGGALPPGLVIV